MKLSGFGLRVLKKMKMGHVFVSQEGDIYRSGATRVPASLMAEFKRHDLIKENVDGGYELSQTGRAFTARKIHEAGQRRQEKVAAEQPSPFQVQHQISRLKTFVDEAPCGAKKSQKKRVNISENPLAWLYSRRDKEGRRLVSEDQLQAADMLRADYERSHLREQMTMRYDGIPISQTKRAKMEKDVLCHHALSAKRRYDAALAAVGSGLIDVLVRVCCYFEGLEQVEKMLSWPARSGKLVLKIALDRLVVHYQEAGRL